MSRSHPVLEFASTLIGAVLFVTLHQGHEWRAAGAFVGLWVSSVLASHNLLLMSRDPR
jgi:hypothetical protein